MTIKEHIESFETPYSFTTYYGDENQYVKSHNIDQIIQLLNSVFKVRFISSKIQLVDKSIIQSKSISKPTGMIFYTNNYQK